MPPTAALTSPAVTTSVVQGTAVTLGASAADTDADGTVARVEFHDGATLLASDAAAPYGFNWVGATVGTHTLTARAYDNAGATATSTVVTLTVTPPGTGGTLANRAKCSANGPFAVGRSRFSGGARDPVYGAIDDVRAYGRALTAAEDTAPFQAVR